ncbi:MAG TPA: hypothetical protein VID48_02570 [Solirubrobacteraceae bacterium]
MHSLRDGQEMALGVCPGSKLAGAEKLSGNDAPAVGARRQSAVAAIANIHPSMRTARRGAQDNPNG